jgi:tetratricopeptide (TPR) repeat protein
VTPKKRREFRERLRRERIRRDKHEQRFRPKREETQPRLPSRFASERGLLDLHAELEGKDFSSIEEANAYLEKLLDEKRRDPLAARPLSPKRQAQELAFQALEAPSRAERRRLAVQALELDPDCVDALSALALVTSVSQEEGIEKLEQAVATGERSLGRDFFEGNRGQFWGIIETRPYMRARFALASELLAADRREEAIRHMEALLELNPNDNQGVRDYLLAAYLVEGDLGGANSVLDRYKEDAGALFEYSRVLALCLERKWEDAEEALRRAREGNPHVPAYLCRQRPLPENLPAYYRPGDESEAVQCVAVTGPAWQAHPAALVWLAAHVR